MSDDFLKNLSNCVQTIRDHEQTLSSQVIKSEVEIYPNDTFKLIINEYY